MCREIPNSVIQMPIYEFLKVYTSRKGNRDEKDFTNYENGRNGVLSGIVGMAGLNQPESLQILSMW